MQYICQAKPVYCHTIFTVTLPTSCWDLVCIKWVKAIFFSKKQTKVEYIDG